MTTFPECPHIASVPRRTLAENLRYRIALYEKAAGDLDLQHELRAMCAEDVLFYCNTFLWTYNPRDYPNAPHRPFVTWDYQDDAIVDICRAMRDRRDVAMKKARQMGGTVLCLVPIEHRWHFCEGQSFLLASRIEEDVDKPGKPKSLFWKLDYMHQWQPTWLLPSHFDLGDKNPYRTKMHMENPDNGSVIGGTATVPDLARGDVLTAILLDEAASMDNAAQISRATRNATHTRIFNSTPKGRAGKGEEFYKQAHNQNNTIIDLHWSKHPEKRVGLYRMIDGRMVAEDPIHNPLPPGYEEDSRELIDDLRKRGYQIEGKLRSPHFDKQCGRATSELEIRQEEEVDFLAEGASFFETNVLEELREHCIKPLRQGLLDVESETLDPEWEDQTRGPWKLWIHLDHNGEPPIHTEYLIGADIAAGLGGVHSSNSVLQVLDAYTRIQVAEFAANNIKPDQLARLAVAACKFFSGGAGLGATLNWEDNGPSGSEFTKAIEKIGWRRIYFRTSGKEFSAKRTKRPGWRSDENEKPKMLGLLRTALREGTTVPRSEDFVRECGEYIIENQKIEHAEALSTSDEGAKKGLHGDRVIAYGVALLMAEEKPRRLDQKPKPAVRRGSMAWRRRERERKAVRQRTRWAG